MPRVETLTNVLDSDLYQIVSDNESEGATVTTTLQPNGKWTVVATFSGVAPAVGPMGKEPPG